MTKDHTSTEDKKNRYEEEIESFRRQLAETVDLELLEDFPENDNGKNTGTPFPYGSSISRPYNFH